MITQTEMTNEEKKTTTLQERQPVNINIDAKRFFPDLIWILKAKDDNSTRGLNYLNVDTFGFCCTDGKRLHFAKNKDYLPTIPNGLWDVKILKNEIIFLPIEGHSFPDYLGIIPKYETDGVLIDIDAKHKDLSLKTSIALRDIVLKFGNGLNIDYLKDLSGYIWTAKNEINAKDKAFHFKSGSLEAVIMPIRQ